MKAISNDFSWRSLHDAVVDEVSVTWGQRAKVKITLKPSKVYFASGVPIYIVGNRLRMLVCPQENPWGPSDFVNEVTERLGSAGETVSLNIEMQSGDVIALEAESFDIVSHDDERLAIVGSPGA